MEQGRPSTKNNKKLCESYHKRHQAKFSLFHFLLL
jgi:hypothetical protein